MRVMPGKIDRDSSQRPDAFTITPASWGLLHQERAQVSSGHATGKGNVDKSAMLEAIRSRG